MDAALFENNLRKALNELPAEFVKDATALLKKHDMSAIAPRLIGHLKNDIGTMIMEAVMLGTFNSAAVESSLSKVMAEHAARG